VNDFEGAVVTTEGNPWWWHLWLAETCRRCVYILVHVKIGFIN